MHTLYSITKSQQGIFIEYLKNPDSLAFNLSILYQLEGPFNIEAFKAALNIVFYRNEVLRVHFVEQGGEIYQEIEPPTGCHLKIYDLRGEGKIKITEIRKKIQSYRFNLLVSPLCKIILLILGHNKYELIIVSHKIILDETSLNRLLHTLSALYKDHLEGIDNNNCYHLIRLDKKHGKCSYHDSHQYSKDTEFWQKELSGASPFIQLNSASHANLSRSNHYSVRKLLTIHQTQQIRQKAKSLKVSEHSLLLSAFIALLHRYTGQNDITLANTINLKSLKDKNRLGMLENNVAVRVRNIDQITFEEFAIYVQKQVDRCVIHKEYPYSEQISILKKSCGSIPNISFNHSVISDKSLRVPDVKLSFKFKPLSNHDWSFTYYENNTALNLTFSFWNNDDRHFSTQFLNHYEYLLSKIINHNYLVSKIPLLSQEEYQKIIHDWNGYENEFYKDTTLIDLFEAQVSKAPNAVALRFENQQLTYRELSTKSNQLAHAIIHYYKKKVGEILEPDVLIGLCVKRSFDMVIGILAILKAGGAYVPIDSQYPKERIEYILEDTQIEILITQNSVIKSLIFLDTDRCQTLCLDTFNYTNWDQTLPISVATSQNLAYVIYTSGSTGRPKGVLTRHIGVVNYLKYFISQFDMRHSDKVLQLTAISFDPSVRDIFSPLIVGASLVLINHDTLLNPEALLETIISHSITVITSITPSLLRQVTSVKSKPNKGGCALRTIHLAGETFKPNDYEQVLTMFGKDLLIVNRYAPTEYTQSCVNYILSPICSYKNSIPIGRPIPNVKIYVLSSNLQPVPLGVCGELHIAGVGLTQGYLNQVELTHERFIDNPFASEQEKKEGKNQKLYKTGDIVRWLPDGNLEYIGRNDFQVKIRGFRIELGEIESILIEHKNIAQAVVKAHQKNNTNQLVAYYVCNADVDLNPETLKKYLSQRLPSYMLPSAFIALDSMPLTVNGKLDRRALPTLDSVKTLQSHYVSPRNEQEKIIINCVSEILGISKVSIHDDLFTLGLDSISLMQLRTKIDQRLGINCAVNAIFNYPTIAKLSVFLSKEQTELLRIPVINRNQKYFPLSFAQQRLWFIDRYNEGSPQYNMPFAVYVEGLIDIEVFKAAVLALINRHECLYTVFKSDNQGQAYQQLLPDTQTIFSLLFETRTLDEQALEKTLKQEAHYQFDLTTMPLIHIKLYQLKAQRYVLMINMHHIISDGWSMNIIFRDLLAFYDAILNKNKVRLPELPIQYIDFSLWQRKHLATIADEQLTYWLQQLEGIKPLELPTNKARPKVQTYAGYTITCFLNKTLSGNLKKFADEQNCTLFMVLLTGFKILLSRYTNQEDIAVGSPVANRHYPQIENVVGFFVNTLVLRSKINTQSIEALVQSVRQICLDAYQNQDIPFESLVDKLSVGRLQDRSSLFQVVFASLQNSSEKLPVHDHLIFSPIEINNAFAKFDLVVSTIELIEGIQISFEFNTDLFEKATIKRMMRHYENILEQFIIDSSQSVATLPLLSADETRQLLYEWNSREVSFPNDKTIVELFEAQVAKTPDNIAIIFEDEMLTYQQLDIKATKLASAIQYHYLKQTGMPLHSDALIGLCVNRSLEMAIGVLGILKGGGAYVPIDTQSPRVRIEYILKDTCTPLVLTQTQVASDKPFLVSSDRSILCIDNFEEILWKKVASSTKINSNNLAYVIYTSGTTGQPKGVLQTHGNIHRLLEVTFQNYRFNSQDVWTLFHSIAFDFSVWELWGALFYGGRVIIPSFEQTRDTNAFYRLVVKHQVTILNQTPGAFQQFILIDNKQKDPKLALRCVIFGGDKLVSKQLSAWHRLKKCDRNIELHNMYGITEATVHVTDKQLTNKDYQDNRLVIGKRLNDLTTYILDEQMQPTPIHVAGELYIGGQGLARGYLNQIQLTTERFISNPFIKEEEKGEGDNLILYKTGDIVSWLPNGDLEYVGRNDFQVKIRGFRIELGEIESALEQHEEVERAIVDVYHEADNKYLVAYFTLPSHDDASFNKSNNAIELVDTWQSVYDKLYAEQENLSDLSTLKTEDFSGWNSSVTHEAIPIVEMQEWLENTVTRIRQLSPRRVLEIGCGTGLLLFKLAPDCEHYVGTDFSKPVLKQVSQALHACELTNKVTLQACFAHNIDEYISEKFDTIILNSVIQYFPSLDYLRVVLEKAFKLLMPGGKVFIGDVRNFNLLDDFHSWVLSQKLSTGTDAKAFTKQLYHNCQQDKELVISPEFFMAIPKDNNIVETVLCSPKLGNAINELTKYRYDVLISLKDQDVSENKVKLFSTKDWRKHELTIEDFKNLITKNKVHVSIIKNIPDRRLDIDAHLSTWIKGHKLHLNIAHDNPECTNINLDQLISLIKAQGYHYELTYADIPYHVDLAIIPSHQKKLSVLASRSGTNLDSTRWHQWAHDPQVLLKQQALIITLKNYLKDRLPSYMVPSFFMPLNNIPLTTNGKLDKSALPAPDSRLGLNEQYVKPRNKQEQQIATCVSAILNIEKVGIYDNLFALGLDSISSIRVQSQIEQLLQINCPVNALFNYQTIAKLSEFLSKPQKALVKIPFFNKNQNVPLSYAQQRLWFLDQYSEGGAQYNISYAVYVDGPIFAEDFKTAVFGLIKRHTTLRTTFIMDKEGHAYQTVLDPNILSEQFFEYTDLVEDQLATTLAQDANFHFNLSTGPLIRIKLYQLSMQKYVLLINMHHIISDGWSMNIILRELFVLYEAAFGNQTVPLPKLTIQYTDFAMWQRDYLLGEVGKKQLEYWLEQLQGVEPLSLPTDKPRPKIQTYAGHSLKFTLDESLSRALKQLVKSQGCTLFMVLLTGFKILLARYSNQEDIVVGTPIANRHYPQVENIIGFFVNTLVLRSKVGNQSIDALLHAVKQTCLEAYQNQDIPFEMLVDRLQVERNQSHSPLFQVMFVLQNATEVLIPQCDGLDFSPLNIEDPFSKFDFTMFTIESEQGIGGSIEFNTDLYKIETMHSLTMHYKNILKQMVEDIHQSVTSINFLTASEYQQLTVNWNYTDTKYPSSKSIIQLFEEQAVNNPENVALVFGDKQLTYRELNTKANQLAYAIRYYYQNQAGIPLSEDALVGLCVERSFEMIIGILGILKSGAAYVPIDPQYPKLRVKYILEDTQTPLVLSQSSILADRSYLKDFGRYVLCLDTFDYKLWEKTSPPLISHPKNLVYIIYTSGTTGRPKGVMVNNHSLVNRIVWMQKTYELQPNDIVFHKTPYSFDVSIWEYFLPLITGAQVIIAQPEKHKDPYYLIEMIHKHKVTDIHFVPSMLHAFLQVSKKYDLGSLKRVYTSGETLTLELARSFYENHPSIKLHNLYGPTEATIDVTAWEIENTKNKCMLTIPIGCPIDNIKTYVLDPHLNLLPSLAHGELYISGEGVARGYLNKVELTSDRFINNPFITENDKSQDKNLTLYKTGDLVHWLPNGVLEYIGRNDFQVKIRGFRIELEEIESTLNLHKEISQAVVSVYERDAYKQLVAYYVSVNEIELAEELLKEYLLETLPDFMVPRIFIHLTTLPLTLNGKLDRKALPAPDISIKRARSYVKPRTKEEKILCDIWRKVLGYKTVGIHDNFFRLGGDSILSIQVITRARIKGLLLRPKDMFEAQTIADLARRVQTAPSYSASQSSAIGDALLLPIQQLFFERKLSAPHHFNQSQLFIVRHLDEKTLKVLMIKLIRHHDSLRFRYNRRDNQWCQFYTRIQSPSIKLLDVGNIPAAQQAATISAYCTEWQSQFSLEDGPLVVAGLIVGCADNRHRVFMAIHHLLVDGVSWRIIQQDLIHLSQNKTLPPKTHSYQAWGNALTKYANTKAQKAREYWQTVVARSCTLKEIKSTTTDQGFGEVFVQLPLDSTQALLTKVHHAYNTQINDILLTALTLAFHETYGTEQLGFYLEGHGRETVFDEIDISRTVGWFTSVFPVHLQLVQNSDIGVQLKSIKEQLRSIPDKGLSYGALLYLSENKALKESLTLAQNTICFNYLGQFDTEHQAQDWCFSHEDSGLSSAKCNSTGYMLDINGSILQERLEFSFKYDKSKISTGTIQELTQSFKNYLEKIIYRCQKQQETQFTPSDFPLANLNQVEIDDLSSKNISTLYRLSPLQTGLLFHYLHQQKSDQYIVQQAFEYTGIVNPSGLQNAWQYVIDTHPILHSAFIWDNLEEPVQIVLKNKKFNWFTQDISDKTIASQADYLNELMISDRQMSFDLGKGETMRFYLVKLDTNRYWFMWTNHHIIADGWSNPIVLSHVHRAYKAIVAKDALPIFNVSPYESYIHWLSNQDKKQSLNFWQEQLKNIDILPAIHINKSGAYLNPNKPIEKQQICTKVINSKLTHKLENLAKQAHITLNTILEFAWGKVLSVYSNESISIYGVTVSGRNIDLPGVEEMVGLFINTVPLVIDWAKDINIVSQLKVIHETTQLMTQYGYLGLNEIKQQSKINGQHVFNTLYVFENFPDNVDSIEALKISKFKSQEKTNYPLSLLSFIRDNQLTIKVYFDEAIFEYTVIENLLGHIEQILTQVVANPELGIHDIHLLSTREYKQLVNEWNSTQAVFSDDKTICEVFEAQVLQTPDAIALEFCGKRISYQALNTKANQLAHAIQKHYQSQTGKHLREDTLIGLCVERSLEMFIGILGILKAGGAYVPIDPKYPRVRIEYILEDIQTILVLTQSDHISSKEYLKSQQREVLCLDNFDYAAYQDSVPATTTTSQSLAYVIYTSGTTGQPKGVMIEHKGIHNLKNYIASTLNVRSNSRVLQFAPIVFDASVYEWAGTLLNGGTLVILSEESLPPKEDLNKLMRELDIQVATLPPAILELTSPHNLPSLHTVVTAGSACSVSIVESWSREHKLINGFGPTEATVQSSIAELTQHTNIMIGKPMSNVSLYVLNDCLEPVCIGVPGELYISGVGLARGYLNQTELTENFFIDNPFETEIGRAQAKHTKLYKTGDIVRWLPDGNIEYIGRNDFQVKIRGFRIELEEIEFILGQQGTIKQAAVIANELDGITQLIAYYVPIESSTCSPEKLKSYLSEYLPNYMVPAFFVSLESLPLTANGKLDRNALPKINLSTMLADQYVAPRNEQEKTIAACICAVLKIDSIGINDDFFTLGMDSISSIRIKSSIEQQLKISCPVNSLFIHSTIASLSEFLNTNVESNITIQAIER